MELTILLTGSLQTFVSLADLEPGLQHSQTDLCSHLGHCVYQQVSEVTLYHTVRTETLALT